MDEAKCWRVAHQNIITDSGARMCGFPSGSALSRCVFLLRGCPFAVPQFCTSKIGVTTRLSLDCCEIEMGCFLKCMEWRK